MNFEEVETALRFFHDRLKVLQLSIVPELAFKAPLRFLTSKKKLLSHHEAEV